MTKLAYAVASLALGQLSVACITADSTSGGDSDAGDFTPSDSSASDFYTGDRGPCPPTSGYGVDTGDVLETFTFEDCDGNLHSLNDLCERQAGWIFIFAGW